ncbi:phenylalanine--tRNA ligase subunit alpha [Neomegalonema sp.]|uniref:phenylalanine--tRNA ligase subunit alpha n=1 Tax=Neomegalonema sp. TaxID=2039713 RepID=UPI00261A2722|nr:phenylalanine--tRNA ligase subunit alpha [Neomegalonema sp.]MDD2867175.1 phenylalanine--tRNA ligase subunit alpha [Neomegalonema sp.]
MSDLEGLRTRLLAEIAAAADDKALEAARVEALGKKSALMGFLRDLGGLDAEARKARGAEVNAVKAEVEETFAARKAGLKAAALEARLAGERLDVTLPARPAPAGSVHPISQVTEEVTAIFADMGFSLREGPQIESDWHNFDALNMAPEHPARQEHDTFFMAPRPDGSRHVLRTHTSPVQIRTLLEEGAPVRFIAPGRVYRSDYDMTHTPMFHQLEGMAIGKDVTMANLKWVLEEFLKAFFEIDNVELRFRASHFPFTEPSAEVDIRCDRSGGKIRLGEGNDWLEILGSGMVHPNVLRAGGVDPDQWQGFAFGMGLDRLAMLKYGIADLRGFFDADLRWLRHYGFQALNVPTLRGGVSG